MSRNARLGLWLCSLYTLFYAGFVSVAAFAPGLMEHRFDPYPNLGVLYGFALIAGAFILAMIYGLLCQDR